MFNNSYNKMNLIIILMSIISACKDVIPIDLGKTIHGSVTAYSEFYDPIDDGDNVKVTISDTQFSTFTNDNGVFEFHDVPIGKYIINFEKDGYMKIVNTLSNTGLEDTQNVHYSIIKTSSTLITNFRLEKEGYTLFARGTITHNSPITDFTEYINQTMQWDSKCPAMLILCSKDSTIALETHFDLINRKKVEGTHSFFYPVYFSTGEDFKINLGWMIPAPYSKETLYYIAYGASSLVSSISPQPSNVFSLTGD